MKNEKLPVNDFNDFGPDMVYPTPSEKDSQGYFKAMFSKVREKHLRTAAKMVLLYVCCEGMFGGCSRLYSAYLDNAASIKQTTKTPKPLLPASTL